MSKQHISLDIVCQSCSGTGLYVGMAERDGAAVVCSGCKGSGKYAYRFEYEPFEARRPAPKGVERVHLARGYILSPKHPDCDGGVPVSEYEPGMTVPADEKLYCPYLYTGQDFCSKPEQRYPDSPPSAPISAGSYISNCKHWENKADCWLIFHAEAPEDARRQVS
jgi:hypothetical protein